MASFDRTTGEFHEDSVTPIADLFATLEAACARFETLKLAYVDALADAVDEIDRTGTYCASTRAALVEAAEAMLQAARERDAMACRLATIH